MAYDKHSSPADLYLGAYLLRFIEIKDKGRNKQSDGFRSGESTVLVKASSLDAPWVKVKRLEGSILGRTVVGLTECQFNGNT